jgi:asparagine synthase (glutamine-hydrolysing)
MSAAHDGPVHTFTITFEGFEHYDESAEARAAAGYYGTDHHELTARLDGPEMLPGLVDTFDEPFGNPTALLISSLSEATREHVKVVLTGDGADELFFGYPRYRGLALAERYRRSSPHALRALAATLSSALPESTTGRHGFRRAREFLSTGTQSLGSAYAEWIGYFTPELLQGIAAGPLVGAAPHAQDFLRGLLGENGRPLDLNDISRVELESFLVYNVLEYADRMSMRHGLELRAPFVDHKLVEYAATLPPDLKLRGSTTKWALREAMRPDLPPPVLDRRKRGLNPPLGAWLAGEARPLVRELLSPEAVRRRGLLRPEAVKTLISEQERGRRDRSLHIWALLVLELWFQRRVDRLELPVPAPLAG